MTTVRTATKEDRKRLNESLKNDLVDLPDPDKVLSEYLLPCKVVGAGIPYTHQFTSGGKYNVPESELSKLYALCAKNVGHTLSERRLESKYLIIDLDLVYDKKQETEDRMIDAFVEKITEIVRTIFHKDADFTCIILKRPHPYKTKNGNWKDGVHVQFPHLICSKDVSKAIMTRYIAHYNSTNNDDYFSCSVDIKKIYDPQDPPSWVLYYGTSRREGEPYQFHKAYNCDTDELDFEDGKTALEKIEYLSIRQEKKVTRIIDLSLIEVKKDTITKQMERCERIVAESKALILDRCKTDSNLVNALNLDGDFLHEKDGLVYPIDDYELTKVLNRLPNEYGTDLDKWIKVAYACKFSGQWKAFDEWSKKYKTCYDKKENKRIWKNIRMPQLDCNYLIDIVNHQKKDQWKLVKGIRPFKPLDTITLPEMTTLPPIHEEHLSVHPKKKVPISERKKHFDDTKHDSVFIKSMTGTGKTSWCVEFAEAHPNLCILLVSHRKTLSAQHVVSFKKLKIASYKNKNLDRQRRLAIVVNSIWKIARDDFSDTILFLDEISDLIAYVLDASIMKRIRVRVIHKLINMIRTCRYLVAVDADISDLVFIFIKGLRKTPVFIQNTYKNCTDLKAYHYLDENAFIEKMKEAINEGKEHAVCYDCLDTMKIYRGLLNPTGDDKRFYWTSGEEGDKEEDINITWCGKFSHYTPAITVGPSRDNYDEAHDVFAVISNVNSISPLGVVQQIARTRNIRNVYYYINPKKRPMMYKTLSDVRNYYKENIQENEKILSLLGLIDNGNLGRQQLYDNNIAETFYCYKFYCDTFFANFHYHFQCLLQTKGYTVKRVGNTHKRLDKKSKKEGKEEAVVIEEKRVNRLLNVKEGKQPEKDLKDQYDASEDLRKRLKIDYEDRKKYATVLFKSKEAMKHYRICKLFKMTEHLKQTDKDERKNETREKACELNFIPQMICLRKLESKLQTLGNIEHVCICNLNMFDKQRLKTLYKTSIRGTHELKRTIDDAKRLFGIKKSSEATLYDLYHLLCTCYTKIFKDIIDRDKTAISVKIPIEGSDKRKNVSLYRFMIHDGVLKTHMDLYKLSATKFETLLDCVCEKYGLKKKRIYVADSDSDSDSDSD